MSLSNSEKQRRYQARHPDRVAVYHASDSYKASIARRQAKYLASQKGIEKRAQYKEINKDKIKKQNAAYRARVGQHAMNKIGTKEYVEYRKTPGYKLSYINGHLTRKYGITLGQYEQLYALQDGCCRICGGDTPNRNWKDGRKQWMKLFVDHDHKTGKVRGLLCNTCNVGLAALKENVDILKSAIQYLESTKEATVS